MAYMPANGRHSYKDIYLDDGISGSDLQRPGLLAFIKDSTANPRVSHLFMYKRDRLARPDDLLVAMKMEDGLTAPVAASSVNANSLRADLKQVQGDIEKAEFNVTLASPDLIPVMGKVLAKLKQKEVDIQQLIEAAEALPVVAFDALAEVEAAMNVFDRLEDVVRDANDLTAVGKAFDMVNLHIFFKFEKRQVKNRVLDKVAGGVVTFGSEPSPVQLYSGPTSRKALKEELAALSAANPVGDGPRPGVLVSGREGNSLGNVSRGDTPLPLVNETKGIRLIRRMLPKLVVIQRDAILQHVEPGLYAKPRK